MADRNEIERKLREFEPREVAALALRAAMRVFPVLAIRRQTGEEPFAYWRKTDRSRHVLAILRCYQISIFGNSLPKIDANARAADATAAATAYAAAYAAAAAATAAATAYAAAYAAAAAADAAARAAADAAFDADLTFYKSNRDIKALLSRPLWPDGLPDEMAELWRQMRSDLRLLHDNYDVWIDWYQDREQGRPVHWELERKWALLPNEILMQHPAEINDHLWMLRDDYLHQQGLDDGEGVTPDLPENQEPGFQYEPAEDGRIAPVPSGYAPPEDAAEVAAMRGIIIKAVDRLITMTSGSNLPGMKEVNGIASNYKGAIAADGPPPIDDIWGYGLWLENAYFEIKTQIESGDYPDLAPDTAAAINTVIAIHGPMIASTARGQELMARGRAYAETQADTAEFKLKAQDFAHAVSASPNAITEDAGKEIALANDNIGKGPHPYRSTETARTANSNLLLTGAKELAVATAGSVAAGIILSTALPSLLAIKAFFITYAPLLRDLAVIPGFEISWLPAFLDWLKAKCAKRSET